MKISLKSEMEKKISRSNREVFLRKDFVKLGGYDQVGRALKQLTDEKKLMNVGYGLYAKARISSITGKPMLAAKGGFAQVANEATNALGLQCLPSEAVEKYQAGSTQIPANAEIRVKGRFSRKIGTDKFKLRVVRV